MEKSIGYFLARIPALAFFTLMSILAFPLFIKWSFLDVFEICFWTAWPILFVAYLWFVFLRHM